MSARDKFLAANAANKQQRGNTSTQDTIFGDFVKRTDSDVATEKIKEVETNIDTKKNSEPVMNNPAEETHTINKESAILKMLHQRKRAVVRKKHESVSD